MTTFTHILNYDYKRFAAMRSLEKEFLTDFQREYFNEGIRVVFLYAYTSVQNELVYQTFIGFRNNDLHTLGYYSFKEQEHLFLLYKENPDFIFSNMIEKGETVDDIRELYGQCFADEIKSYI